MDLSLERLGGPPLGEAGWAAAWRGRGQTEWANFYVQDPEDIYKSTVATDCLDNKSFPLFTRIIFILTIIFKALPTLKSEIIT